MDFLSKVYYILNERIIDRYGLAIVLKQYGFYPQFLPTTITGEHGPSLWDHPIKDALNRVSPFYFVTSKYKEEWNLKSKALIRHPSQFVWYRRRHKIVQSLDAKGSLFFLAHSSKQVKAVADKDSFFQNLEKVPAQFCPITICLHFNDLESEFTRQIEDKGYQWLSLARSYTDNQIEEFYRVVPKFRFVLGNSFTSGLMYACEMGIPASIIFYEDVYYENQGNKSVSLLKWSYSSAVSWQKKAHDVFIGFHEKITKEQIEFTQNILGLDLIDSIGNRVIVSLCLYASLIYVSIKTLFILSISTFKKIFIN